MSNPEIDPTRNTQEFRAFVRKGDQEPEPAKRSPLLIGGAAVAVLVAVVVVIYLLL
ncbi:hypothetical protein [Rhizohabitans arisaemae]|uniref:hypothetical protein n=1 Tax=Rhizohabitans arisaemae TaxID=2720610 RepID=UPI0024B0E2BC|nr:hypothetical protein [Rhizohabitans arisaemae]